jgi:hypothetical protein
LAQQPGVFLCPPLGRSAHSGPAWRSCRPRSAA